MSLREQPDENRNKNCPNRGLGLAAAAIGVGVGAALYYIFNKRQETPDEEGSTSRWQCEQAQALSEEEQIKYLRDQAFRERAWSLEGCSICFDPILDEHQVMTLPCTHHFHEACVLPWLQQRQTCPNCRKPVA